MTDYDYKKAKKRVKEKKDFYKHFASSFVIVLICLVINAMTSSYAWWLWVLIGMGFSVVMHFITVFGVPGLFKNDEEWEERQIERELRKRGKNRPYLQAPQQDDALELRELEKDSYQNYDEDSEFV